MRRSHSIGLIIGLLIAGVSVPIAGAESTDTDTMAQLQTLQEEVAQLRRSNAQLQTLRNEVAQLRAQEDDDWLNEQREQEIKSLIHDVLADAETRASLLDEGLSAGHDGKHFFLASPDGTFLMEIAGQIQVRYIANFRDNTIDGDDAERRRDDFTQGFEIRRAKLNFSGHIASPKIGYEIQIGASRTTNNVEADKIKISYKLTDTMKLWAGEDKAPFLREELTSSKRQLTVERSYFNEEFTVDKVQGIGVQIAMGDNVKIHAVIHDGIHSGNPPKDEVALTQLLEAEEGDRDDRFDGRAHRDASDVAFTTRIELMLAGNWKQMKDFTSFSDEELAVFLGFAFHYEVGETGSADPNNDIWSWTVDGSIEANGLSFFAAIAGQHSEFGEGSAIMRDFDKIGVLLQTGYNMPVGEGSFEPFVRYEWIDFDTLLDAAGVAEGRDDQLHIVTFGANYYFKKHNAKFTVDVVLPLDNVAFTHSGLNILRDAVGEDGQVVVRSQFQLLY